MVSREHCPGPCGLFQQLVISGARGMEPKFFTFIQKLLALIYQPLGTAAVFYLP